MSQANRSADENFSKGIHSPPPHFLKQKEVMANQNHQVSP